MTETKDKNSYKSILKGVSFLAGTQMFLVLISLIRGKFVALLLGPEGMGIANLFNTSANTIQRFSSLGLNLSIVKETAECKDNPVSIAKLKHIALRLTFITATFGALFCLVFSGWLSRITFGDESCAWQFRLLSLMIFLTVAANGKLSLLQGLHEVKAISKSSIIGSIAALSVSVPLYYFYGIKGIVPAMVIFSLVIYITYSIFLRKKMKTAGTSLKWSEDRPLVKKLISLGLILMASDLIGSVCNYVLSVFISSRASEYTLGLYQSANSITSQYLGVIFTAMSVDYLPRLAAVNSDYRVMTDIVNRQSLLISLAATPLVIILITLAPLVIKLLLSDAFMPIKYLLRLMAIGALLKAFSFSTGYITLAKGNRKLFFFLEGIFCNLLTLSLGCIGFKCFGLYGMGYAMIADFSICTIVYYVVNRVFYGYRYSREVLLNYIGGLVLVISAFGAAEVSDILLSWLSLAVIAVFSVGYSFLRIRKLLNLSERE